MKKILLLVVISFFLITLPSCAYYKQTIIKARGKDISVPIGEGFVPVKGEGVVISVLRQVFLMPKDKEIQKFTNINIEDETEKGDLEVTNP